MASIYVTGDIHGNETRLGIKNFPEQKEMIGGKDENFVIITGDFGLIWNEDAESKSETWRLNWLEDKPFTTVFVSGNHENFDRLYSNEYEIGEWHGGRAQFIRPHVIHLLRGECYNILGKTFFCFGGASSHDVEDGILEPDDERIYRWRKTNRMFRINHLSWWKEELASEEEMQHGRDVLAQYNNEVDYIVSHCLPQEIAALISCGMYKSDSMTMYLQEIATNTNFKQWYCGHYHTNQRIYCKFNVLYENIVRIC